MKPVYYISLILAFLLTSCYPHYKYHTGSFPSVPVNMGEINSKYDDYNSSSPVIGRTDPLCFSSNRDSNGNNFDIVAKILDVYMSKKTGILTVEENANIGYSADKNLFNAVYAVNTAYDELGPYLVPMGGNSFQNEWYHLYILLYSSDASGNFDIKFTENFRTGFYTTVYDIQSLNSDKDDLYPALSSDRTELYFCSDRDGDFDIYYTYLGIITDSLNVVLKDPKPRTIVRDDVLSSDADDKCPFILADLMVFASNRPGGYGGYDLYYSTRINGIWSAPVNFGDKINTSYDEFRPIVKPFYWEFTNDMMIFSSNRPGGYGGFDLYYVGVTKTTASEW